MTNAHILHTILELADTEPDENGQIPTEVRRQMQAVASVSRDPEAVKQLFAPQTQMSWQPYQGDRGGKGWFHSETGEIRYQQEMPQDNQRNQQEQPITPKYSRSEQPKTESMQPKKESVFAADNQPRQQKILADVKDFRTAGQKFAASLSDQQKTAISNYVSEEMANSDIGYRAINKSLREKPDGSGLSEEQKASVQYLNTIASNSLPKETVMYRGINLKGEELQHFLGKMESSVGQEISLHGLSSFSLDPKVGLEFSSQKIVFEAKSKTGAYISEVTNNQHEMEILQSHGVKYKVAGVKKIPYGQKGIMITTIQMEEV